MTENTEAAIIFAVVFIILFFLGGLVGLFSLPSFPGRFYLSGLVLAIFGTGAGALIVKVVFYR